MTRVNVSDSAMTPCLEAALVLNFCADDCDREPSKRFLDGPERFPNGPRNQHSRWQNRPSHPQRPPHRPRENYWRNETETPADGRGICNQ